MTSENCFLQAVFSNKELLLGKKEQLNTSPNSPDGDYGGMFSSPMKYFAQDTNQMVADGLLPSVQHSVRPCTLVWCGVGKSPKGHRAGGQVEFQSFLMESANPSSPVVGTILESLQAFTFPKESPYLRTFLFT